MKPKSQLEARKLLVKENQGPGIEGHVNLYVVATGRGGVHQATSLSKIRAQAESKNMERKVNLKSRNS